MVDITKITLKELLSASKTKALISNVLGNALLKEYKGSKKRVVVVKGTSVNNNNNSNFFCANILENQAQWRDKTRGLINLIIESNA